MVTFDPTITLGHVLELCIVGVGALGLVYGLKHEVGSVKEDVQELREDMEKITDVLTTLARQDERLKSLEAKRF